MMYKVFDMDGTEIQSGSVYNTRAEDIDAAMPTHGSISFDLGGNNGWINLKCSEWLTITKTSEPEGWRP